MLIGCGLVLAIRCCVSDFRLLMWFTGQATTEFWNRITDFAPFSRAVRPGAVWALKELHFWDGCFGVGMPNSDEAKAIAVTVFLTCSTWHWFHVRSDPPCAEALLGTLVVMTSSCSSSERRLRWHGHVHFAFRPLIHRRTGATSQTTSTCSATAETFEPRRGSGQRRSTRGLRATTPLTPRRRTSYFRRCHG